MGNKFQDFGLLQVILGYLKLMVDFSEYWKIPFYLASIFG